jgi:sulfatase maturation enzyme AslB (radical SAM superfamily)
METTVGGRVNMKRQRTIEWQTNGICNYNCSYCIQSPKYRQGYPTSEEIDKFLRFFSHLEGEWEIKMSGGEPFAFPGFMNQVIPGLAQLNHRISVLTNLSASPHTLSKFCKLIGHKINIISASLHREFVSLKPFLTKLKYLRSLLPQEVTIVVNSVLVPTTLAELLEVKNEIESAGFIYFPQWLKTKTGTFNYSESDREILPLLIGDKPNSKQANLSPSYYGYQCWAGVDYFILDQFGNAWSCRTAKRYKEGYLGNVFQESVKLWNNSQPCPYTICPCTVPANRGMIEYEQ